MAQPNVILLFTDDQEIDTSDAPSMPYLGSDPYGGWLRMENGVLSTPLCYPSRANMVTGQRSDHNGQRKNAGLPPPYDENNLIFKWAQDAGYFVGMIGKLGNSWPNSRAPFTPAGIDFPRIYGDVDYTSWSVWDGETMTAGTSYITDVMSGQVLDFLAAAEASGKPWFLYYAPIPPHDAIVPASRHGSIDVGTVEDPPDFNQADVSGCPPYIRNRPLLSSNSQQAQRTNRIKARKCMRALDEGIQAMLEQVDTMGEINNTLMAIFTDNGVANGRKRIPNTDQKKKNPYRFCHDMQLRIRVPGQASRVEPALVTSVDLVATLLDYMGATPGLAPDGLSFRAALETAGTPWKRSVEFHYLGDSETPQWWALRHVVVTGGATVQDYLLTEWVDGGVVFHELYDQVADPHELVNRYDDPALAAVQTLMLADLDALRADSHALDDEIPDPPPVPLPSTAPGTFRMGGQPRQVTFRQGGQDVTDRVGLRVDGRPVT